MTTPHLIEDLRRAVEMLHRCSATHQESRRVEMNFRGQTVWHGHVEVFDLNHSTARRCFAWIVEEQPVVVLELPPVDSAEAAVRSTLALPPW